MFPLSGKTFPTTSDELAESIREALSDVLTLPKNGEAVKAEGKFPKLKKLTVNLNGATISATEPPPQPKPTGKREPGIEVGQLEILGHPIKYERNKVDLGVTAKDLHFDFAHDKKGNALLVLTEAGEGNIEAKVSKDDMQALLLAAAQEAAKQQKINIVDLQLDLTQNGPRSVAVDARVTAKKMLIKGIIHIKGKLDIDEDLNATISDLSATGEGAVGSLISGVVQSKLKPYNGRSIPLMTFSLGDVALRDLKITVKNNVQVTARFGKA
jgi:hypothetical protein